MPENQKIAFNLATAEREKTYEPFVVALPDGETVTLNDPRDLDWKDLVSIENPPDFFRLCLSEDDKAKFRKAPIPGWALNQLMEAFQIHYGLGNAGNGVASRI